MQKESFGESDSDHKIADLHNTGSQFHPPSGESLHSGNEKVYQNSAVYLCSWCNQDKANQSCGGPHRFPDICCLETASEQAKVWIKTGTQKNPESVLKIC